MLMKSPREPEVSKEYVDGEAPTQRLEGGRIARLTLCRNTGGGGGGGGTHGMLCSRLFVWRTT